MYILLFNSEERENVHYRHKIIKLYILGQSVIFDAPSATILLAFVAE